MNFWNHRMNNKLRYTTGPMWSGETCNGRFEPNKREDEEKNCGRNTRSFTPNARVLFFLRISLSSAPRVSSHILADVWKEKKERKEWTLWVLVVVRRAEERKSWSKFISKNDDGRWSVKNVTNFTKWKLHIHEIIIDLMKIMLSCFIRRRWRKVFPHFFC